MTHISHYVFSLWIRIIGLSQKNMFLDDMRHNGNSMGFEMGSKPYSASY